MAFLGRPSRGLPTVLRAGPRVGAGCTIHTSCQPAGVCVTHWESLSASLRPLLLPAVHGPARSQGDLVNRPLTAPVACVTVLSRCLALCWAHGRCSELWNQQVKDSTQKGMNYLDPRH